MTAKCPVCAGPGETIRRLGADEIAQGLEAVFGAPPPDGAIPADYDLVRCT